MKSGGILILPIKISISSPHSGTILTPGDIWQFLVFDDHNSGGKALQASGGQRPERLLNLL